MDNENNREKNKESFWEKLILVLIPAVITGIIALIIANKLPWPPFATATTTPTIPTIPSLEETSAITETPNWAITFEYKFPAGYWSIGTHEYTFEGFCPNVDIDGTHSVIRTQSFEVSNDASPFSGDVYLRIVGLRDAVLNGQVVTNINPQQTTIAAWSLIEITQSDAQRAVTDCSITISLDGGAAKSLQPGIPFQR